MTTEIFYYSGTGFTLEAAKIVASEIGGDTKLTPIVGAMKKAKKVSTAQKIGLFMPMHAMGIPQVVNEFLKVYRFPTAEYVFALVTRGGAPTNMHRKINARLKKQGKKLNAFQYATTPNTFDIVYKVHEISSMTEGRADFLHDVRRFGKKVCSEELFIDQGYRNRFLETFFFPILHKVNILTGYFRLQDAFYADEKCTGCGTCARVCLSEKVRMFEGRPEWQKNISCQFCLACIQLCPSAAVQVRNSKTSERNRIFFPGVDIDKIAAQKNPAASPRG